MKFQIDDVELKYLGDTRESTIREFVAPSHLLVVNLIRVGGVGVSGHPDTLHLHFSSSNSQFAIICENVRRAMNPYKVLGFADLDFLTPIEIPDNINPTQF